ncbi:MAG: hypothetical protein HDR01_10600 [Lachnospiraceae bacterium]|nr:hypothetical protein [Lachnospiraceae bacterium]
MIKDEKSEKLKIAIFNVISAIIIVLFWFTLYYFFENHGWLFFSKEECLLRHENSPWEWLNMVSFGIVYFLIGFANYRFTDLSFWSYMLIQAVLDFALFSACMLFMEKISWFVPITGLDSEYQYREFRALVHYGQQYIFAFFVFYGIMVMIYAISKFLKRRRDR